MNWIIGTLLVLFSAVGGSLGWWKGTKDLASPPDRYDRPIGVGRREHERRIQKRYRRRRVLPLPASSAAPSAALSSCWLPPSAAVPLTIVAAPRLKRIMTRRCCQRT